MHLCSFSLQATLQAVLDFGIQGQILYTLWVTASHLYIPFSTLYHNSKAVSEFSQGKSPNLATEVNQQAGGTCPLMASHVYQSVSGSQCGRPQRNLFNSVIQFCLAMTESAKIEGSKIFHSCYSLKGALPPLPNLPLSQWGWALHLPALPLMWKNNKKGCFSAAT